MDSEHRHFLIIGGQRCGSTYLTDWLHDHPEVEFAQPMRPEPKYFLSGGDHESYDREHFGGSNRVRGEKSTSYLDHGFSAENASAALPDAIIVVLVRDPVERAISNYAFSRDNGIEELSLSEALTESAEHRPYDEQRFSASPFHYLRRGRYAELLHPWLAAFGREQMHVMTFDQLTTGSGWVTDLCAHLQIQPAPGPPPVPVNASNPVSVKTEVRERLGSYFLPFNERLSREFGIDVSRWAGSTP